jgi:hypothetical protein
MTDSLPVAALWHLRRGGQKGFCDPIRREVAQTRHAPFGLEVRFADIHLPGGTVPGAVDANAVHRERSFAAFQSSPFTEWRHPAIFSTDLTLIMLRAIQKERSDRYQTASEMAHDLACGLATVRL